MLKLENVHHIAIICSNYERSKAFYVDVLGLIILQEVYRKERDSYKLDLMLNDQYVIELFSFPDSVQRPTRPEANGLRHLAFAVKDLDKELFELQRLGIVYEELRVDDTTGKRFIFFRDPDDLPIELYEN
jgi:glyoxylase I family protein